MSNRVYRVACDDNNFVVIAGNGNPILTSKSYANKHSTKRAAKRFIEDFGAKDIVLEFYDDTSVHSRTLVRQTIRRSGLRTPVSLAAVKALSHT